MRESLSEMLRKCFEEQKIEYYGVLDYKDTVELSPGIRERLEFEPRSVIVYLLPYYVGEAENMSRYATSLDYHIILREVGERIIDSLKARFPSASARAYGDHSPIDECRAAVALGLGVLGENTLVINAKYGSYVFVGDVVTDIPPEELGAQSPLPVKKCIGCGACKAVCPTGILRGECDSCLSSVTQRKGELSEDEREMMRKVNTGWGCDECQSVCPYNREPRKTPIEFFYKERITKLTREMLDGMTRVELSRRAFGWRGRAVVERNIEIVSKKA